MLFDIKNYIIFNLIYNIKKRNIFKNIDKNTFLFFKFKLYLYSKIILKN